MDSVVITACSTGDQVVSGAWEIASVTAPSDLTDLVAWAQLGERRRDLGPLGWRRRARPS